MLDGDEITIFNLVYKIKEILEFNGEIVFDPNKLR